MPFRLNWCEIHRLVVELAPLLEGASVDRVVVPARHRFSQGYLKGEWAIRLLKDRNEFSLLFSVNSQSLYFYPTADKGPKAAKSGSRSPFDLVLNKEIKGRRIQKVFAWEGERIIEVVFQGEDRLRLVLCLIPAQPEAVLLRGDRLIATHRMNRESMDESSQWQPPASQGEVKSFPVREEIVGTIEQYRESVEVELDRIAFRRRVQAAAQSAKQGQKSLQKKQRAVQKTLDQARSEPDWFHYGDLLKAALGQKPRAQKGEYRVFDWETSQEIKIPAQDGLGAVQQVEKYYRQAKRKKRRLEESQERLEVLNGSIRQLIQVLESAPDFPEWKALADFERELGMGPSEGKHKNQVQRKNLKWAGKSFVSQDGFSILLGRNWSENMDLIFKVARGNDVWMHVKGRTSAHAVVLLPREKTAPLSTLLEAAQLILAHSGGKEWGKVEIDYTLRKYVKRIKGSRQVSYTQQKTLMVGYEA